MIKSTFYGKSFRKHPLQERPPPRHHQPGPEFRTEQVLHLHIAACPAGERAVTAPAWAGSCEDAAPRTAAKCRQAQNPEPSSNPQGWTLAWCWQGPLGAPAPGLRTGLCAGADPCPGLPRRQPQHPSCRPGEGRHGAAGGSPSGTWQEGKEPKRREGRGAERRHLEHKFLTEGIPVLHPAPARAARPIL